MYHISINGAAGACGYSAPQKATKGSGENITDIIAEKLSAGEKTEGGTATSAPSKGAAENARDSEPESPDEKMEREFEAWKRENERQKKAAERECCERRQISKLRLKKYIKKQQEKKLRQRKALEKAVECEQTEHREKLSEYWKRELVTGDASPGMLTRRRIPPKAAASSYETSFMLKDPKI